VIPLSSTRNSLFLSGSMTGAASFPGVVWIECQHTAEAERKWADVQRSLVKAARAIRTGKGPKQLYLYVVATSARNDAKEQGLCQASQTRTRPFLGQVASSAASS